MKRVKHRTLSALVFVLILFVGLGIYLVRYFTQGGKWVSFSANQAVYSDGILNVGTLLDRNGMILASVSDGERTFAEYSLTRRATLHAVGDKSGNIGTGAIYAFAPQLIGYNPVFGVSSFSGKGQSVYLTLDANLNEVAYEALAGRKGTVAVCNYETGEVLCMVSSPTFDPADPPSISDDDESYEGVYINRFLSSTFSPGSTFKLVTTVAALEKIDDLYDREFYCAGSLEVERDTITCTGTHGTITIEEALAVSCNCAFAELALELGGDTISKYFEDLGFAEQDKVNGILTASGKYDIAPDDSSDLGWSGVGQYNDMVNPAAMLKFMCAIANGGEAKNLNLIYKSGIFKRMNLGSDRLLKKGTADELSDMMSFNVHYNYGADNYPGLELHAKSGTAEVGGGKSPHAWFVGFISNPDNPLAFVVLVENGGSGSSVAGSVANTVLQAAISG